MYFDLIEFGMDFLFSVTFFSLPPKLEVLEIYRINGFRLNFNIGLLVSLIKFLL